MIYDPLGEYEGSLKGIHKQNVEEFFDGLVSKAGTDIEANRATIKKRNIASDGARAEDSRAGTHKGLKIFLIIMCVVLGLAAIIVPFAFQEILAVVIAVPISCAILMAAFIVIIVVRINKVIKQASDKADALKSRVAELNIEAGGQMASLNSLFTYDICEDLVAKTLPLIRIDKRADADKIDYITRLGVKPRDGQTSVASLRTGNSGGNPFLLVNYKNQNFVQKTYKGSMTVSWTVRVTDSKGHTHTEVRSQMLVATVTKPVPNYYNDTYLYYANEAAPNLGFSRAPVVKAGSSEKDIERLVKKGAKRLEKKAQTAVKKGETFTMLANADFEVLFGAENRDHEVQFRLMYTPLAQQNMIKLIKNRDDFYMYKAGKLNAVYPALGADIPEPVEFCGVDYDGMREKFVSFNCSYFEGLYHAFSPLFAVPLYQSETGDFAYNTECKRITDWEAEPALYKLLPEFVPDNAATDTILNVSLCEDVFEEYADKSGAVDLSVTGLSFVGEPRVDHVPRMAGNGVTYMVPVHWTEYLPIHRTRRVRAENADISEQDAGKIVHGLKFTLLKKQ